MEKQKLLPIFIAFCLINIASISYSAEYKVQPLDADMKPIESASSTFNCDFSDFRLEDALRIAISKNRTIKTSEQNVEKADSAVKQARAINGAKLSANISETWLDNDYRNGDSTKIYLELKQPLYLGKKDKAAINSARTGRDMATSAHTLTKQAGVRDIAIGYYAWLNAREVEELGRMNVDLAQAHYDLVNKRYQAQQASKYELLRADVRLVQTKSDYIKDQNDRQMAELRLLNMLSLPMDTILNTSCKLEIETFSPNVKEDIAKAINEREDLKIKHAQEKIARQSLMSARGEREVTVNLWGQAGQDDPKQITQKKDDYWQAGLICNLPLFDAGLATGKVKEARASIKQAENDYADTVEQAHLEIYQTAISLNNARQVVISQQENLKQAEETLRLAKVRYENGLFTQVDLFDAEIAWSSARLAHITSIFGHHQARIAYLLAIGQLGRDIEGF